MKAWWAPAWWCWLTETGWSRSAHASRQVCAHMQQPAGRSAALLTKAETLEWFLVVVHPTGGAHCLAAPLTRMLLPFWLAVEMPASASAATVDPALLSWATSGPSSSGSSSDRAGLPAASTRVIEVHRLSTDFRQATHVMQRPLPAALPPGAVLIRRLFAGINASDVNYSAGRYGAGLGDWLALRTGWRSEQVLLAAGMHANLVAHLLCGPGGPAGLSRLRAPGGHA